MGGEFMHQEEKTINLAQIVQNEIKASSPILMCSMPGFQGSGIVDLLVAELNNTITSITVGKNVW